MLLNIFTVRKRFQDYYKSKIFRNYESEVHLNYYMNRAKCHILLRICLLCYQYCHIPLPQTGKHYLNKCQNRHHCIVNAGNVTVQLKPPQLSF